MSRAFILLIILSVMASCHQGNADSIPDQSAAFEDSVSSAKMSVPEVERDTVEFDRLLKQYYKALPDVGDTAIWGTWEEHQNPPVSILAWQKIPSDPGAFPILDSVGLPAPLHFIQPQEDSAFYLPTAEHWVRCNTADQGYETELANYYFYQGYLNALHTYFFAGCSVRIGGTCDYYMLDSLASAVRVVRCEYDSPYRYVAWSERDSALMFISNDGFSSRGMYVKALRVKHKASGMFFDHLHAQRYLELTASDLRIWPEGGFAVRIVENAGDEQSEEAVWRRVNLVDKGS